ncbi:MAG TPA: RNA polymerase sigma factor [Candidatus Limnocylindrales bacterium]
MHRALVELAQRGDEEAFADLTRAVGDGLLAIAYRILRDVNRAEDAVQQALVTAWRELPTLRDPDRFEAWLRRLLVHACYAEARRQRRWAVNVRLLPIHESASGDDAIATVADRDQLERGFRRLSPEQRAIFVFHHHLGLTLTEIADELGVPLGTVKSRLFYATSTLRAALDADARAVTSPSTERLA